MAPNKMQGHFWHVFLTQFFMLFDMLPSVLLSMVASITTYFKESDWLLKNLYQSESGWKSYHGEQNWGYHVKEHTKLCQRQLSKVTLHFVWGQLSRKQTARCANTQENLRWSNYAAYLLVRMIIIAFNLMLCCHDIVFFEQVNNFFRGNQRHSFKCAM